MKRVSARRRDATPARRPGLVERGLERIEHMTWSRTVEHTGEVYERLLWP